jgi:Domain of unknown function (DUF4190)
LPQLWRAQTADCGVPLTAAFSVSPPYTGPQSAYQPSPYQQPYSYALLQRPTNGFAVASLVLGILGCFFFLWALSAIFGFIALSQTKDGSQGGRGMAIAGLVLSGIWFLCTVAIMAYIAVHGS